VFEEFLRKRATSRAARRALWLAGSTAAQAGLLVALLALTTSPAARVVKERVVDVQFVRVPPGPLRALPPLGVPLQKPVARAKAKTPPRPVPAVIQPKALAAEIEPPRVAEPEEPDPGPDVDGVVGGAIGEVANHVAVPVPEAPARPEFDAATMTRPVFVSGPDLTYTERALEQEVEGLMVVRCVVSVEGTVRDCRVLKGLPYMDSAVVEALELRRYRPALQGGKPIEVSYVFKVNLKVPR